MELQEFKIQVEDLKLILLNPKLFINKYFEDLINQLDIHTINFEIKVKSSEKVNKINDWRQLIVDELKQAKLESLSRITSDFKFDFEASFSAFFITFSALNKQRK